MGERRGYRTGTALLAVACGLAGAALGYGLARGESALLRGEIARLEASRVQLADNAHALEQALRDARAPLARRIHELEEELARAPETARLVVVDAGQLPAETLDDATPPDAGASADEPEKAGAADDVQVAAVRATEDVPDESAAAEAPAEPEPAPLPAVSAPVPDEPVADPDPAPAANDPGEESPAEPESEIDPACEQLMLGSFELARGEEIRRLGGRLGLRLDDAPFPPGLHVEADESLDASLVSTPFHVSITCDGVGYIVSVCRQTEPGGLWAGVIRPADGWDHPCRD